MFYDVEPFWFYVLIERKRGDVFTTVGYFSKEKNPVIDYNLSCIMVLPAFMGHGYGKFRKSRNHTVVSVYKAKVSKIRLKNKTKFRL